MKVLFVFCFSRKLFWKRPLFSVRSVCCLFVKPSLVFVKMKNWLNWVSGSIYCCQKHYFENNMYIIISEKGNQQFFLVWKSDQKQDTFITWKKDELRKAIKELIKRHELSIIALQDNRLWHSVKTDPFGYQELIKKTESKTSSRAFSRYL